MDGNDAGNWSGRSLDKINNLLYHWLLSLRHDVEALRTRLERLLRFRRAASLLEISASNRRRTGLKYIVFQCIPKKFSQPRRRHLLNTAFVDMEEAGILT